MNDLQFMSNIVVVVGVDEAIMIQALIMVFILIGGMVCAIIITMDIIIVPHAQTMAISRIGLTDQVNPTDLVNRIDQADLICQKNQILP